MSSAVLRPTWLGFENILQIAIFGDSYSDVGYRARFSPNPSESQPLGVGFPGITFTERDTPNWVGHLITDYVSHGPILVYDYAVGGHTVSGVRHQIEDGFLSTVGKKPEWAPWSATNTLFVTWVGINDCGSGGDVTVRKLVEELFEEQARLYEAGARNFLFFDVPPIHLSPIGREISRVSGSDTGSLIYQVWNTQLQESVAQFSAAHPDATMLLFSSWDTFTRVLDDPVSHGFSVDDVGKSGGGIWVDDLHPTSKMHDWIARDVAELLGAQPPYRRSHGELNK